MHKIILTLVFLTLLAFCDDNKTEGNNSISEINTTKEVKENIQKVMEEEKKFAKEQKFYQGDDYNLTEHEVDEKTLDKVPVIEPEYDFDITDLYAD